MMLKKLIPALLLAQPALAHSSALPHDHGDGGMSSAVIVIALLALSMFAVVVIAKVRA